MSGGCGNGEKWMDLGDTGREDPEHSNMGWMGASRKRESKSLPDLWTGQLVPYAGMADS
jgi:hypothetical protein